MSYSPAILNAIDAALTEVDIKRDTNYENGVIVFNIDWGRPRMNYKVFFFVRDSGFCIHAIFPISANHEDEEEIHNVAEFVCRANYGLVLGHFNLDMRDGEIQYQTTIDCTDIEAPSTYMVNRAFGVTMQMCEKYAPGFHGVILAGQSAKEACERCEADDE
ncbi:MAG: YbjN domain-containing protein [Planctomycetia bacterium]|nr:YbjN domain-containing protein [Planctomycetia bacterium]